MRVSVIIPTYNRAHYVSQAIDSVLAQTHEDFEILIVDDGSTDNTREIVSRHIEACGDKIRYFHKENGGCASARNAGLKTATGDFIAFLDSDDLFQPRKLEIQLALLRERPDCQFVYSDSIEFEEHGKTWISPVAAEDCLADFAIEHFQTTAARASALLYRRKCIEHVGGFDETLRLNEDSDFLQRVAISFRGCYSDYPSVRVRHHSGSKSRDRVGIYRALLKSSENILREYPQFGQQLGPLAQKRRTEIRLLLVQHLLLAGEYDEAREVLRGVPVSLGRNYRWSARLKAKWLVSAQHIVRNGKARLGAILRTPAKVFQLLIGRGQGVSQQANRNDRMH